MEYVLTAWLIISGFNTGVQGEIDKHRVQAFSSQERCELYAEKIVKLEAENLIGIVVQPDDKHSYEIVGWGYTCTPEVRESSVKKVLPDQGASGAGNKKKEKK